MLELLSESERCRGQLQLRPVRAMLRSAHLGIRSCAAAAPAEAFPALREALGRALSIPEVCRHLQRQPSQATAIASASQI
jgi:hypothetical protein